MSAPAPGTVLFTSGELSSRLAASLRGAPDVGITGIEILDAAGPTHLSFIRDAKNVASWKAGRCGAALASQAALGPSPPEPGPGRALIVVPDADLALIQVLASMQPPPFAPAGVHPSAVVDPSASIGEGASIGPLSWIGPGASVGAGTVVSAGAMIGRAARIGAKCLLHPRVTVLERCVVGDHCILHSGVVLGADGFGYRPAPGGKGLIKVPHIGIVELEPHVEVGANSAIDRAKFGVTRIGAGTKIDNLVQIGHNCVIGRACVICGNVGIGGSTRIGDGVMIGGGVGIADQRTIGPGASIGAGSGVMEDIPAGQTWFGFPAQPVPHAMKMVAAVRQLPGALSKVRRFLRQQGVDLD